MTKQTPNICPLCDQVATEGRAMELTRYRCDRCGHFTVSPMLDVASVLEKELFRYVLSGVTREATEFDRDPVHFTLENVEQIRSYAPKVNDVDAKARKLLRYVAHKSSLGQTVHLGPIRDYPICYASDTKELNYIVDYLTDLGWAKTLKTSGGHEIALSPKGWAEVSITRNEPSDKAFVAMWFADEMADPFKLAIKLAIEQDAHYRAVRIDQKEFNTKIDDEIIAEIRESRFLVADFTGHRGGVYFEAGYAMGLGIPVIWLCREDHLDETHFDTRQFNHIAWKPGDLEGLRKSLGNRIRATIGIGPVKPQQ